MTAQDRERAGTFAPTARRAMLPIMLIVSLFFMWGVANNLNDVLIPQFRKVFALNDLQSGLVQSAFYLGYFCFALPAALFMRRFGYKAGVVLGLCLFAGGALLFYPAAQVRLYGVFLAALFVIASGLAFLETSANPLMTVLGPAETGARRLNFAQAFNPLGSITAILVGRQFILSGVDHSPAQLAAMSAAQRDSFQAAEAHAVQAPYLVIAAVVLAWAAVIALTRFPAEAEKPQRAEAEGEQQGRLRDLLKHPRFLFGVVAQFFYVGAQVGVWSYTIRYAERTAGLGEKAAAGYLTAALVAFAVGRFAGAAAMSRVRPAVLTAVFACAGAVLCVVAAVLRGKTGLICLVASSFFMSVMYPTIFAVAISGLGELRKLASAFIVMAIIGGAALTALMGLVSDRSSIAHAMFVPAASFLVVAAFALYGRRAQAGPPQVGGH